MIEAISNLNAAKGLADKAMGVTQAIKLASASTGVDFAYLMNKASQESSLNPAATSATSSATGLFQFVEQTWLRTVKTYGAKYGLGAAAERISIGADGVARVKDPSARKAILDLRKNPAASAGMAAELTNENKTALKAEVGGPIGSTELYLAHFLGAGGASEFLNTMRTNPNAKAAEVLPEAAAANHGVFYDKSGKARSLSQIYQRFAQKFDEAPDAKGAVMAEATTARPAASLSVASVLPFSRSAAGVLSGTPSSFAAPFTPDSSMSSPFAAMVLAQMDMGDLSALSSSGGYKSDDEQKKKSSIALMDLAA